MNKYSTFIQRLIERCIARITPYVHPKSIRKLFILIFSLLISMFVLMFLITSFYYSTIVRNQAYESMKTTLNMYNNNISQGFYEVSTYLSENSLRNSDVSSLSTTDDTTELYLSVSKIKATLAVGNYSLSNIGGLFVYSSDKDLYKSLLIQIRGYCYEYKEQVRIHLTHIDSGIGFDENYLELYNHITDHPEIHEKGRGIGLYNTAMRLNLTFNESAHIEFSNEPGLGARVDIDFPYFAYEQEELPQ